MSEYAQAYLSLIAVGLGALIVLWVVVTVDSAIARRRRP